MLHELFIKKMALIDEARVRFGAGLNVLTGETGAGKTVVVGAVNLLLGGRAETGMIRQGSDKAEVQGLFSVPQSLRHSDSMLSDFLDGEDQLIIHRVISLDGKNRCYINDRMVTVKTLSEVGRRLIDLHGQHEHQSLFKVSSHVNFLDKYGGPELIGLRERFQETHKRLRKQRDELSELRRAEKDLYARKDLLLFQVNEINKAGLVAGEDRELAKEREILRNAEKLYGAVAKTLNLLSGGVDFEPATGLIAGAVDELRSVSSIDSDLDALSERLNSLLIEMEDCTGTLRDYGAKLEFPPERLQEVDDRLALISLLKKKYGPAIEDIIAHAGKAENELLLCDTSEERAEELERAVEKSEKELSAIALRLSDTRKDVAEKFLNELRRELADLNMPGADFRVSFTREQDSDGLAAGGEKVKIYAHGIDKVEFQVSANKGEMVKPLTKIASGGEISRIMLALKIVLADADEVPTLIFDEIDVGIGGKTAMAVGKKMAVLGKKHQVLAVTHLPQIASCADTHFSVSKKELGGRVITEVSELVSEGRISEMARLLSGNERSDVSLKHAEEMLVEAKNNK